MENAKIEKLKYDILGDFQTLWKRSKIVENVPENQGTFFLGTWKGLFCRQKNNTCFACTKCNITEKNMKHPAMLARVKIENCRFAREREICIEKMASSIFLSSCIFSSNPWLSSWNRLQAWNAWHGKESTRSHLNASWHFYNVWKYVKNVSISLPTPTKLAQFWLSWKFKFITMLYKNSYYMLTVIFNHSVSGKFS